MTKITRHDKITSTGIQIERLENFLKGVTVNRYSLGAIEQLRHDLAKLYKRYNSLLDPKPRPSRKRDSGNGSPVDLPTGDYVNTKARRGRHG